MTPVLVGELNPYGEEPEYALYPSPEGSAGYRLCCMIFGMRRLDYLRTFERVNLCVGEWSMRAARARATQLADDDDNMLVLLGARVASAFDLPYRPFETFGEDMLVLPHPSGLCRVWNEPDAVLRARIASIQFFRPYLPEVAGAIAEP